MSIYRAYDVRGIYGKDLDESVMESIGKALGTLMHRKEMGNKVVVGNDVRLSSPSLSKALSRGLMASGVDILDVGTTSFGLTLFSGFTEKCVTAYVTASHNPPEWNGVKFFGPDCVGFFQDDNMEIGKIVKSGKFQQGKGTLAKIDRREQYIGFLESLFKPSRIVRIVIDCGNGSTSLIAPEAFRRAGFDVIELFSKADGRFPGRGPDVTKEACSKLGEKVRKERADFGIAFDGDGDRMAAVDEQGRYITTEALAVVFAKSMLRANGNKKVICNVDCSLLLEDELEPLGAKVIRIPVGNTFMMQEAKIQTAVFGTESSQHFVFPSYLPFDDGIVAGLKLASIATTSCGHFSSLFSGLQLYPRKTKTIDCPEERKAGVMEEIERFSDGYKLEKIDGLRYIFDDGWGLIRPSNTSPVIKITAEGKTEKAVQDIFEKMKSLTEDII